MRLKQWIFKILKRLGIEKCDECSKLKRIRGYSFVDGKELRLCEKCCIEHVARAMVEE